VIFAFEDVANQRFERTVISEFSGTNEVDRFHEFRRVLSMAVLMDLPSLFDLVSEVAKGEDWRR